MLNLLLGRSQKHGLSEGKGERKRRVLLSSPHRAPHPTSTQVGWGQEITWCFPVLSRAIDPFSCLGQEQVNIL